MFPSLHPLLLLLLLLLTSSAAHLAVRWRSDSAETMVVATLDNYEFSNEDNVSGEWRKWGGKWRADYCHDNDFNGLIAIIISGWASTRPSPLLLLLFFLFFLLLLFLLFFFLLMHFFFSYMLPVFFLFLSFSLFLLLSLFLFLFSLSLSIYLFTPSFLPSFLPSSVLLSFLIPSIHPSILPSIHLLPLPSFSSIRPFFTFSLQHCYKKKKKKERKKKTNQITEVFTRKELEAGGVWGREEKKKRCKKKKKIYI